MKVRLPEYAQPFFGYARDKCLYGGRAGGKTWSIARILAIKGMQKKLLIHCCREFQKTLAESAKPAIQIAIQDLGLSDYYNVQDRTIKGINGTEFHFFGLERNKASIKGWESVDIVWVEEAERLSHESAKLLEPTIRKAGSERWYSWNPKYRTDWVWRRFVVNPEPGDMITHVTYKDNPFRSQESEDDRLRCLRVEPELYPHIWLGMPDDEGDKKKLLPFVLLQACQDGWKKFGVPLIDQYPRYSGLDIADTGVNRNSWSLRGGPCLIDLQLWRAPSLGVTARKAHKLNVANNVIRMYYDAGGGYGGGVRSHLIEIKGKPYRHTGIHFGEATAGKKIRFDASMTNEQAFMRRGPQMYWNIRLRAQRSREVLLGNKKISPARCFWINPEIAELEDVMAQFTQPEWDDPTGHYQVKKDPDDIPVDAIDSTALAWARDSEAGLVAR